VGHLWGAVCASWIGNQDQGREPVRQGATGNLADLGRVSGATASALVLASASALDWATALDWDRQASAWATASGSSGPPRSADGPPTGAARPGGRSLVPVTPAFRRSMRASRVGLASRRS
jgi:hypothetical protein